MIDKLRFNGLVDDLDMIKEKLLIKKTVFNHKFDTNSLTGNYDNAFVSIKEDRSKLYIDYSPIVFLKGNNIKNVSYNESLKAVDMLGMELDVDFSNFNVTSNSLSFNYELDYPVTEFLDALVSHRFLKEYHFFNNGKYFENQEFKLQFYNKSIESDLDKDNLLRVELLFKKPSLTLTTDKLLIKDLSKSKVRKYLLKQFKRAINGTLLKYKPRKFKLESNTQYNWTNFRQLLIDNYLSDPDKLKEIFDLVDGLPERYFTTRNNRLTISKHLLNCSNENIIRKNSKHSTIDDLVKYLDNLDCTD